VCFLQAKKICFEFYFFVEVFVIFLDQTCNIKPAAEMLSPQPAVCLASAQTKFGAKQISMFGLAPFGTSDTTSFQQATGLSSLKVHLLLPALAERAKLSSIKSNALSI
jgi:hypothetical protein